MAYYLKSSDSGGPCDEVVRPEYSLARFHHGQQSAANYPKGQGAMIETRIKVSIGNYGETDELEGIRAYVTINGQMHRVLMMKDNETLQEFKKRVDTAREDAIKATMEYK